MRLYEHETFRTASFVIVCDRSYSMKKSGALAVLDDYLPKMVEALRGYKRVRETAKLAIVGFSEQAEVLLPLSPIGAADQRLAPRVEPGKTDFAPPLQLAYRELETLVLGPAPCFRPIQFFLSDGYHNMGAATAWQAARARLVDRSFVQRPTIVTLGMGDCDRATMEAIASEPALYRHFTGEPVEVIRTILDTVLRTTIRISQSRTTGPVARDPEDLVARILGFRYGDDDDDLIDWVTRG